MSAVAMRPAALTRGATMKAMWYASMVLPAEAGHVEQRPQPDLVRPARQHLEAELGDDAVLADQRHDVGEGADGGDLDERREPGLATGLLTQGLHQLQRHADAGQVLVGIAAVAALGVDDGQRRAAARASGSWWSVMMRSTPSSAARRAASAAADAAVDRDDHLRAVGVQPLDRRRLQAVAVAQPLGDEMGDVAAEQLEGPAQDHGRGDAVDVVVAVDDDALAGRRRRAAADRPPVPCR